MSQEATLICIDNSDWARNADYLPTRLLSQIDATHILFNVKMQSNPENTVGIVTMAGDRVVLKTGLTQDNAILNGSLYGLKPFGTSDFIRGIQTAQLALKNRPKKNQQQRIICFVASPMDVEVSELELLGRTLKKNNVFIDVISFGEIDSNREKLDTFMQATGAGDNNRFLEVPAGSVVSDNVVSSPIAGGFGAGGFNSMDDDPELAAAIAASLQDIGTADSAPPASATAAPPAAAPAIPAAMDIGGDDEEFLLALRLSLEEAQNAQRTQDAAQEAASGLDAANAADAMLKDDGETKEEEAKKEADKKDKEDKTD